MDINWSAYQQDVFDFVANGKGSAIVEAVAGSGKSTTILEAAARIPTSQNVLMLAFNKSAAGELKAKCAKRGLTNVEAKTFHGLGYGPVRKYIANKGLPVCEPNGQKVSDIIAMMADWGVDVDRADKQRKRFADDPCFKRLRDNGHTFPGHFVQMAGGAVAQLVSLAKQNAVGELPQFPEERQTWRNMIDHHDIVAEDDMITEDDLIDAARKVFAISFKAFEAFGMFDFDDMIYLVIRLRLRLWQYAWVFVDEAQDTNPVRRFLARAALRPYGRLIAVGDPHQAIYGFTGASNDALALVAEEFGARTLPLTVSYRCPKAVVTAAREFVSHIESAPNAAEGVVDLREDPPTPAELLVTDAVLCRKNAPLVKLAYQMISEGRPCKILGRDIGQGLVKFIDKLGGKTIEQLNERLQKWANRERKKLTDAGREHKLEQVQDKLDCVTTVIDSLPESRRTVARLRETFENMFSDESAHATTFSTVHKAKGMEWPRVFIIGREDMPSKMARQEWQMDQEINLIYVAYTRAQEALIICNKS